MIPWTTRLCGLWLILSGACPTRSTTTSSLCTGRKSAGHSITYVLNERDRPVLPEAQEEMARRLPPPATTIRVDSGHLLPVTAPATMAKILLEVTG